ncbi:MAG TPA: xanthine dehydrogenase family protein molybdopterin-binding subunit [Acidimicrobiia bacterium]|nr:xanthine dehydrogenase family protein molybdopterin-binding subunit [Acidimicrobiia bacterium]
MTTLLGHGKELLGASVRRLEDEELVSGHGAYVADLVTEDTLHCAFVRSPVAHGTFDSPHLEDVLEMPGVVAVFTNETLGLPDMPSTPGRGAPEAEGMGQPTLARDRVRHVGDPVAVVVADTQRRAVDAADTVWVDFDPLPVVADTRQALTDETLLFPGVGTNQVHESTVGSPGPRPEVDVETEVVVDIPRVSPVTIEPLAILARPLEDGLEVWCGHQAPARIPNLIGPMLGLPPGAIRSRVPFVGGAFGTKGQFYVEYPVVCAIAHKLGRPVAWIQRRGEQLLSGTHGRGQVIRVRVGGDRDGRIRFARIEITGDAGAYPLTGSRIPFFTQLVAQGAYDIEHVEVRAISVVTNRAPTGPYRGAGRPEGAIAIERAVDAFAAEIGMLPEEVRRRNFVTRAQMPFTTHTGAVYDSGDYGEALDLALDIAGIEGWRDEQKRRLRDGGNPIGIGIGSFIERAGGGGEYGRVELSADGIITVRTGSMSAGQGHRTVWAQVAASVFGVPMDRVVFYSGDTHEVAGGIGSFGSRSAQLGAAAVYRTAQEVALLARKVAAEMLEAADADLELVDGHFRVVGSPGSEISLADVASRAAQLDVELAAEEMFDPESMTFPYGTYVAVVEVDVETGHVGLLSLVAVDDCGNVLNPMIVEGQLHGSIMQGLGTAFLEEVVYDEDGQPLTSNLMTYLIPTATQPMPLLSGRIVHPSPTNPLGVKGTGEAGCIGVPPAVLNAVHDALRPLGVRSLDFPITPAKVWQAIRDSRSSHAGI